MTFKSFQALAWVSFTTGSFAAKSETSKLMVHIPHSLYKPDGYNHREALFGMPPYGGSIAQAVYYAGDDDLCGNFVNVTGGYPQRPDPNDPWPSPFILLVDRGNCAFTTKVRNAQRVGAAGVLIADNTCVCADTSCVSELPCEATEPVMSDDGSGADISIPSMLVFKTDGDTFKQELMDNNLMQVEMSWSLPRPDNRVEYVLYTTPSDEVSKKFLLAFKHVALKLDKAAHFTPHQYIYDGYRMGCIGKGSTDLACASLCTNKGRYCATDPDGDLNSGVSGAMVVQESLRRLCIWEHYGRGNGIGIMWWTYIHEFMNQCDTPDLFANDDCIDKVFQKIGMDSEAIDRCFVDSGGLKNDNVNSKLDMELDAQTTRGVVVIPSVYVNTEMIHGALNTQNVFGAICAGYLEGSEPKLCQQCAHCPNPVECAYTGFCTNPYERNKIKDLIDGEKNGVSTGFFYMTLLFCMGGVAAMGVWYHNKSNMQMREHMRNLLAQYMPLDDDDANGLNNPMEFTHNSDALNPLVMPGNNINTNQEGYQQPPEGAFQHHHHQHHVI